MITYPIVIVTNGGDTKYTFIESEFYSRQVIRLTETEDDTSIDFISSDLALNAIIAMLRDNDDN